MPATSLTRSLLDSDPDRFTRATQAPFLSLAGKGLVPKSTLSVWLSQDRIYAQAYITFVGALISRVRLPEIDTEVEGSLHNKILQLLVSSLDNIQKELQFFSTTAKNYHLLLSQPQEDDDQFHLTAATGSYRRLFQSFGSDPSKSLLEGLVVLWATEQCYLSAWTFAASCSEVDVKSKADFSGDQDGGALRNEFIPNWTSAEFEKFVDEIAHLTDSLAETEKASPDLFEDTWIQILEVEEKFWPEM